MQVLGQIPSRGEAQGGGSSRARRPTKYGARCLSTAYVVLAPYSAVLCSCVVLAVECGVRCDDGGHAGKSSDNDNPELSAIEAELSGEADGSATVTPNNNNSTNNNGNTASHMAAGQSGRMQTSGTCSPVLGMATSRRMCGSMGSLPLMYLISRGCADNYDYISCATRLGD